MLATAQKFVDADGCAFAVANAIDDEARSKYTVTTGEDSRSGGHQGLRIHGNQSARGNLDFIFGSEEVETRRLADRHDDGVALDLALAVFIERGIEAFVLIKHPLRRQHLKGC